MSMKVDPIIAVKDVEQSSLWYQSIFNWKSMHGGNDFDILVNAENKVMLCLHKWGEHQHPTMIEPTEQPGNGLILYYRTRDIEEVYNKVQLRKFKLAGEFRLNQNSGKKEFSLRDPDGYYVTISEYHEYQG